MAGIEDVSTEDLLRMRGQRQAAPADIGQVPTDELVRMRGAREAAAAPRDVTAGMALRGVPVLGAYVPQAEAALQAFAQPLTGVGAPGTTFSERYGKNLPQVQGQYAQAERTSPITSEALKLGGGMAALGPVGATAMGGRLLGATGPLAARLAYGAGTGGLIGGADIAARGGDFATGAKYGAAGGAVGALGGRVLEALPGWITGTRGGAERAADVARLEREGVQLSAGQRTGSRPLQIAEEESANLLPFGTNPQEQAKRTFTQAVARRAGIDAENLRPEVMDQALKDFDAGYRGFAARNSVDNPIALRFLGQDMARTVQDYTSMVGPSGPTAPADYMGRIIDAVQANSGTIPGDVYQMLRSKIGSDARRAVRGAQPNFYLSDALYDLQANLDNAMARSVQATNPGDLAQFQQLNRWYRNFLPIERAITGAGEEARWGLLSPMALRNALVNMQGRRAFGRGAGDLAELAGAGESVMKGFPQSGTAARKFMGYEAPAALGVLAHGLFTGNPPVAGAGLLGLVGPPAASAAILSRPMQRYLSGRSTLPQTLLPELGVTGALQTTPEGYPYYQR